MKRYVRIIWIIGLTSGLAFSENQVEKSHLTADHSRFAELQKDFSSGEEVTQACNGCHNLVDHQFRKTVHWTWSAPGNPEFGKGGNSMNNFCISTNKMHDTACLNCHTSWSAKGVDGEVNCLKCHSGQLMNWTEAFDDIEGLEIDPEDEEAMMFAREIRDEVHASVTNIGLSQRENCGSCHFKGGGGDAVKHGDLDSSLLSASRSLDVHMSKEGGNFSCTRCHTTEDHHIAGRIYADPAIHQEQTLVENDRASKISCVSCHTEAPHEASRLNNHTRTLSCQACHIPEVAREEPTMVEWDWSTAGRRKDGRPYKEKSEFGGHFYAYKSIKGSFKWEKDLVPEYHWYNGSMSQLTFGDEIDPSQTVFVNRPVGRAEDGRSKIVPFKTMRTIQPFDVRLKRLAAPLLSTPEGFWKTLDWESALAKGMEMQGLTFSGEFDFVPTEFSYSLNHMIAPAAEALDCVDCHRDGGRLEQIAGVYIPGRDNNPWADGLGLGMVILSWLGVLIHGTLRYVGTRKMKRRLASEVSP